MNAKLSNDGPSVETLIAKSAPASEWTTLFGNRKQAALHFANVYQSRYGVGRAKGRCIACDGDESGEVVRYLWEAKFFSGVGMSGLQVALLFLGRISVKVRHEKIAFQTFHPLCKSCATKLRFKRIAALLLYVVSLIVTIVAGFAALAFWGVVLTQKHTPAPGSDKTLPAILASILAIAGLAGIFSVPLIRTPPSIRFLGARPYYYKGSKLISVLK